MSPATNRSVNDNSSAFVEKRSHEARGVVHRRQCDLSAATGVTPSCHAGEVTTDAFRSGIGPDSYDRRRST